MKDRTAVLRQAIDWMSLAIVVAAVCVVGVRLVRSRVTVDGSAQPFDSKAIAEFQKLADSGRWIGSRKAPVVILVYSDYSCGYCRELHATLQKLQRRYPQHVAIVMKHFVRPATLTDDFVPIGAECAGDQGRFAEYNDAAFSDPRTDLALRSWSEFAKVAHVADLETFNECVLSRQHLVKITEQYEEGRRLGVTGTPTLFVNGHELEGAVPFEVLDSIVVGHFPNRVIDS